MNLLNNSLISDKLELSNGLDIDNISKVTDNLRNVLCNLKHEEKNAIE